MPLGRLLREISSVGPRTSVALPGEAHPVSAVAYDSRRVIPGSVFVCLRGLQADGHLYAAQAMQNGAAVVVGEQESILGIEPYVHVDDSRRALALLACAFHSHPSRSLLLTGVTGTNGKTSVTWMLDAIHRENGLPSAVLGTLGSGTPESGALECGPPLGLDPLPHTTPEAPDLQQELARWRDAGVKAGAMEVSSHGLALHRSYGTRFAAVVFTNLSTDHLDFHGTLETYLEAKRRLFLRRERGPEEPSGIAVVNGEDPAAERILAGTSDAVLRFGRSNRSDVHPGALVLGPEGIRMRVCWGQSGKPLSGSRGRRESGALPLSPGEAEVVSPLLGSFQVENLLAAFTTGLALGFEPAKVALGLGRVRGIPGRMERVGDGVGFRILVDYAHTPDALARALASLRPFTPGRILLVFGCGGDRDRSKRRLMGEVAAMGADWIALTDDNPRSEDPAAIRSGARGGIEAAGGRFLEEGDRESAIRAALEEAKPGDTVLVAGKGAEEFQIRGGESLAFDDRVVVRRLLGAPGTWGRRA